MVSLAPMEGLTTIYYRRALARWFGGVDRYFTPFLTPTQDHRFTKRELREVLLEHNGGLPTVPQLLTRNAEDFLWAAGELAAMGYREVNLNLGCPSGTVVAKGKGSGFLAHPAELDAFLEEIFSKAPCAISVKTRIGLKDPEEFPVLLAIYRKYPLAELIVHPRVRTDMYKNTPGGTALGRRWRTPPSRCATTGTSAPQTTPPGSRPPFRRRSGSCWAGGWQEILPWPAASRAALLPGGRN